MDIPQDSAFIATEQEKNKLAKFGRILQWILVLSSVAFLVGYFCLLSVWWLLGAVVNPSIYLPYASGALTFITFIHSKYKQFKNLGVKGREIILSYLNNALEDVTNKVMKILSNRIQGGPRFVAEKAKDLLNGPELKSLTGKLISAGILNEHSFEELKKKIEGINSSTIISLAANTLKDPQNIINSMNDIRTEVIRCIKTECEKKNIPSKIIDIFIASMNKNNTECKKLIEEMLTEKFEELKISPALLSLILELCYPTSIDQKDFPRHMINLIFNLIMEKINCKVKLDSKDIFDFLEAASKMQRGNKEKFLAGFIKALDSTIVKENIPAIKLFQPFFHHIFNLSSQTFSLPTGEMIKNFFKDAIPDLIDSIKAEEADEIKNLNFLKILSQNLPKFLEILFIGKHDLKVFRHLQPDDVYDTIKLLIKSLSIQYSGNTDSMSLSYAVLYQSLPKIIYLVWWLLNGNLNSLPKELEKEIDSIATLSETDSSLIHFSINFLRMIFYQKVDLKANMMEISQKQNINMDICEFFSYVYSHSEKKNEYPLKDVKSFAKNKIFAAFAKKTKLPESELLGLIDFLFKKFESPFVQDFLKYVAKTLELKTENMAYFKLILEFLCTRDEDCFISACKQLNLGNPYILLVARDMLNPKYLPKDYFEDLLLNEDVINERLKIYERSQDDIKNWKKKIVVQIESKENFLPRRKKNLYRFAFTDLNEKSFSFEKLSDFVSIIDEFNDFDILSVILGSDKDKSIDFFVKMMRINEISLFNNQKLTKNEYFKGIEIILRQISQELSVDFLALKKILETFCTNDHRIDEILNFILEEEGKREYGLLDDVMLDRYDNLVMFAKLNQDKENFFLNFTKKIADLIEIGENKTKLPFNLYRKIIFKDSDKFTLDSFLEFGSLYLSQIKEDQCNSEVLYNTILEAGLAFKGIMEKKLLRKTKISSKFLENILNIMTITDEEIKFKSLVRMIPSESSEHLALCLWRFLSRGDCKIILKSKKRDQIKKVEITLAEYLSNSFWVYPEAFLLLNTLHSRNLDEYLEVGILIMKRISGNNLIDPKPIRTILAILLGKPFDHEFFASALKTTEPIIETLVSISRLALSREDSKQELSLLAKRKLFQNVLKQLGIRFSEFSSIIRLLLGHYELKELESILGTFKHHPERSKIFALMSLCKSNDLNIPLNQTKAIIMDTSNSIQNLVLFNKFGYPKLYISAIFRITAGNFLTIKAYPELFDWAFPPEIDDSRIGIENLVTGLCGLMNPRVRYNSFSVDDPNFSARADSLFKQLTPNYVDNDLFKIPKFKRQIELESSEDYCNSVELSVALVGKALDINPMWFMIFLLDLHTYKQLNKNKEFLLLLVANFSRLESGIVNYLSKSIFSQRRSHYKDKLASEKNENQSFNIDYLSILDFPGFELNMSICLKYFEITNISKTNYWDEVFDIDLFNMGVNRTILELIKTKYSNIDFSILDDLGYLASETEFFISEAIKIISQNKNDFKCTVDSFYLDICNLFYQQLTPTEHKSRIPEPGIDTFLILGSLNRLRYENFEPDYLMQTTALFCAIQRLLCLDQSFSRMSIHRIMKILVLAKPIVLDDAYSVSMAGIESVYTQKYMGGIVTLKFLDEKERKERMKISILDLCSTDFKYDKENERITSATLTLMLESQYYLQEYHDFSEENQTNFEPISSEWIEKYRYETDPNKLYSDEETLDLVTGKSLKELYGTSFKPFGEALKISKEYLELAYGEINYSKPIKSLAKNHEKFVKLMKPFNEGISSDETKIGEILWAILSKTPEFPTIENYLGINYKVVELIFSPMIFALKEKAKSTHLEVINYLCYLFGVEDRLAQYIEMLLDVFTLEKQDSIPKLALALSKEKKNHLSEKIEITKHPFIHLLLPMNLRNFKNYKLFSHIQTPPTLLDQFIFNSKSTTILNHIGGNVIPLTNPEEHKIINGIKQDALKFLINILTSEKREILEQIGKERNTIIDTMQYLSNETQRTIDDSLNPFSDFLLLSTEFDPHGQITQDVGNNLGKAIKSLGILNDLPIGSQQILSDILTGCYFNDISLIVGAFKPEQFKNFFASLIKILNLLLLSVVENKAEVLNFIPEIFGQILPKISSISNISDLKDLKIIEIDAEKLLLNFQDKLRFSKSSKFNILDYMKNFMDQEFSKNSNRNLALLESVIGAKAFPKLILEYSFQSEKENETLFKIIQLILKFHENSIKGKIVHSTSEIINDLREILNSRITYEDIEKAKNLISFKLRCLLFAGLDLIIYLENSKTIDVPKLKNLLISFIKEIVSVFIKDEAQKTLIINILSAISMINLRESQTSKISFMTRDAIVQLILKSILPEIFPSLSTICKQGSVDSLFRIINSFEGEYKNYIKNKSLLLEVSQRILNELIKLDLIPSEKIDFINQIKISFSHLVSGEYFKFLEAATKLLFSNKSSQSTAMSLYDKLQSCLDFSEISSVIRKTSQASKGLAQDPDRWVSIMSKIKDGKAVAKDLFILVDEAGDGSGSINQREFKILANRLGVKLSDHRISEIFAKIKEGKTSTDLTEKEFEKALTYLQQKNLTQTLLLMGITPEMLTAILLRMVIILLLILIFIFFGIQAFALGGTFGSIINSIIPAAAGLGMGKSGERQEEKLDGENVSSNCEKALSIVQSDNI